MNAEELSPKFEYRNPCGDLDPHPLTKRLPGPDLESAEWKAFIDGLAAAGPDAIPPIVITDEGLVMDGCRRLLAAKRLQWDHIPCVVRPEWEAPLIILESFWGQKSYTKSAKAYLSLPLLKEYSEAAHQRQVIWLQKGVKKPQIAQNSPLAHSVRSGKVAAQLAETLGVSARTVEYAVQIRQVFESAALKDHKFEFQDGSELTLREYFEPQILDAEDPMGLGAAIRGIGEFVHNGKPVNRPPPARNTPLRYMAASFENFSRTASNKWLLMPEEDRAQLRTEYLQRLDEWPADLEDWLSDVVRDHRKNRSKKAARHEEAES